MHYRRLLCDVLIDIPVIPPVHLLALVNVIHVGMSELDRKHFDWILLRLPDINCSILIV